MTLPNSHNISLSSSRRSVTGHCSTLTLNLDCTSSKPGVYMRLYYMLILAYASQMEKTESVKHRKLRERTFTYVVYRCKIDLDETTYSDTSKTLYENYSSVLTLRGLHSTIFQYNFYHKRKT